jgi:hypothetical protein
VTLTNQILSTIIRAVPQVLLHLASDTIKALGQASYDGIRATYWLEIYQAVFDYITGSGSVVSFRNRAKTAASDAFVEAGEAGYTEGGGELPMDEDTLAWLAERQAAEFANIDGLFDGLRDKRSESDAESEALARAEGYASTLDQIWSEAKTRGAQNKMLTFTGSDGKESCKDCQRMKGQRHRASWWISHDMVPGSSNYECGGWNCEHYLEDDEGNQFTI